MGMESKGMEEKEWTYTQCTHIHVYVQEVMEV